MKTIRIKPLLAAAFFILTMTAMSYANTNNTKIPRIDDCHVHVVITNGNSNINLVILDNYTSQTSQFKNYVPIQNIYCFDTEANPYQLKARVTFDTPGYISTHLGTDISYNFIGGYYDVTIRLEINNIK